MNKLFRFLISLILFSLLLVGCSNQTPDLTMNNYKNRFFEMDYPEKWTYEEDEMGLIIITKFIDPENKLEINIGITSLGNDIDEKELFDLLKEEIENVESEENIDLIESNIIKIDSYEAVEVIYVYDDEQKLQRIMAPLKGNIMSIEARSKKDDFHQYQDIINHMVKSIKVTNDN